MPDSYRPGYGDSYSYRDQRDDHYAPRYDQYGPPPRGAHPLPPQPPSRDYYEPRREHYNDNYRPDARPDYTFRGVTDAQQYRPCDPRDDFSFRAGGPPAPHFLPAADNFRPPQPQKSRARNAPNNQRDTRQNVGGQRGRGGMNGRGRSGFGPKPAYTRAILSTTHRETTPEQLQGMNVHGQGRFREVDESSSDESDEVIDLTSDQDYEEAPRKRGKFLAATETAAPKWSNPDPYTALPPPETLGAPKKDIVQVIRKAKVEQAAAAASSNAVKDNVDFISFNFDDDMQDDGVSSEENSVHGANGRPKGNCSASLSHPADLHRKLPTNGTNGSYFGAVNELPPPPPPPDDLLRAPPPPPKDLIMPTQEEIVAQLTHDSQKRKQPERRGAGDIVEEWQSVPGKSSTPWCTIDHSNTESTALRLHKEICDFYDFVRPYDYEDAVRRDIIVRVQSAIRSFNVAARDVEIHCFGSFAARLHLPTADMDLVAISDDYIKVGRKTFCQSNSSLHRLNAYLTKVGVAMPGTTTAIAKAKVPIVKFIDKRSGIKVDISFENDAGIVANKTFQQWKAQYPAMPILVILIKQMLNMRGLNEVFTGGIGGFTTICLVVSMMQRMPELQSGNMDPHQHYGDLLLHFLDLYGNKFNIERTGIVMEPPRLFDKIYEPHRAQNDSGLTIIDPNRPENDISGGSREIGLVLDTFRDAHSALQHRLAQLHRGKNMEESVLGCVMGGNYDSFLRQRNRLSLLERGYAVSPPPVPVPQVSKTHLKKQKQKQAQVQEHAKAAAKPVAKGKSRQDKAQAEKRPKKGDVAAANIDRANTFKQQHPQISDVPSKLTKEQLSGLKHKHKLW